LRNVKDKNPNFEVLDLGCGIGQSGEYLKQKNVAKRIVGVDISDKMLEQALKRKVVNQNAYDKVVKEEISRFLSSHNENYDLIISDLSFCHFGDLDNIAFSIDRILNSGGILAFILKKNTDLKSHYKLDLDEDEFTHSELYVKDTFAKFNFNLLSILEVALPEEKKAAAYIFTK
jgi:predicted TPR repeat methyltransferase